MPDVTYVLHLNRIIQIYNYAYKDLAELYWSGLFRRMSLVFLDQPGRGPDVYGEWSLEFKWRFKMACKSNWWRPASTRKPERSPADSTDPGHVTISPGGLSAGREKKTC